jgi:hypothetical protein
MKLAVLSALVAGTAAFAPVVHQRRASATALAASPYADELGAMKPVSCGKENFM